MRLTVVVPCFDEEAVLQKFHHVLNLELAAIGDPYEILYVDDGSRDGTLDILKRLAGADGRTRYLSLSRNFGKESAMLAGLRHADGDATIIMDADLQHPPELIPRMLELHFRGFDQVVARRTRSDEPVTRKALARTYYWAMNRWADVDLVDGVGDFRLLSRRATDAVASLDETNRFSKGLFAWIGFESVMVEYQNVERGAGRSKWTIPKLLDYGLDGLLSFNKKPLRPAIYAGLLLSLFTVGHTLVVVAGVVDPHWHLTLLAGMGGVLMVMLGVIGEYIGRIYNETKRRPQYLVKDTNLNGDRITRPG